MRVGKAGEVASIKRHAWELLNAIFRQACSQPLDDEGTTLLSSNPVLLHVDRPRSDRAYVDVSMEELNTLYEAMPGRFALVIYLVGVLSLRPGEAYALQRRDVNLADDGTGGRLHVGKSAKGVMRNGHKVMTVGSTKTPGSVRDLDIPAFMVPAIRRHLDLYVDDRPDGWLFTGERSHTLVFDQSVRNAWYRARKAVPRLEERRLRLYDLRHRALTEVVKHTNSLKAVMAQGDTRRSTRPCTTSTSPKANGGRSSQAWKPMGRQPWSIWKPCKRDTRKRRKMAMSWKHWLRRSKTWPLPYGQPYSETYRHPRARQSYPRSPLTFRLR